jgi:Hint domain-containing protein
MTIPFAFVSSISPDTTDGQSGDGNDFITRDPTPGQYFQLQGLAAGSGTLGIWLTSPGWSGARIEIGSVTISPTDGVWTFNFPISQLPDGNYTIQLTDGTATSSTIVGSQSLVVDDQKIAVGINAIEGNNILTNAEIQSGLTVTGTATGNENQTYLTGETIQVEIRDSSNNVLFTQDATVQANGTWNTTFSTAQLKTLTSNGTDDYNVYAAVQDKAGNAGNGVEQFTSTVCFMAGTLVSTPRGPCAVETLAPGVLVLTSDGREVPVTWLGRQTVSTRFADPLRVLPIRIKAGALGDEVPSRDLLLSPDHAILVDGALIHAGALVNGTSIVRETNVPEVFTYYHVEADDHSLILAENTPAETFVDNVDRLHFDNWAEHQAIYPDGKPITELPYPRAKAHRQVPTQIRVKLADRAHKIGAVASAASVA